MVINNYTLDILTKSLCKLTGYEILECFTQEKDVLVICIGGGENELYLLFNTFSKYCSLYLKNDFRRARANSIDLMPELTGETVQGFSILPGNRIIRMDLINSKAYFMLFGSAKTNLIMTDSGGIIINSFKSAGELKGTKFDEPEGRLRKFEDFAADESIFNALAKSDLMLGKYYAAELLSRLNTNQEKLISEFSNEFIQEMLDNAQLLTDELKQSKEYYILEAENKNSLLSLIKLAAYPIIIESLRDISKAIERRIISAIKHDKFFRGYSQIAEKLKGKIRKLNANIALYSDNSDAVEREQAYRQFAELLASQPNIKDKSGDRITLDSWDGSRLTIPLDPKMNLLQNSAKYFDKARRAKESVVHRKKLLPGLQKQLADAEVKLAELETAHSLKEIENIGNKGNKMQDQNDNSSKYKVFGLGEGYTLYVGKSAANNDELTMRFAKPNDLWFHARGSSGSHCVLKATKDDKVPKSIIQAAAQIAAYYSKSKNAKYTPVCYTYKKYVRKPKGADIGSVTIQREEVIMVEPKLPEGGE
jgi:predicted ribosome quality control (RQC) complex YloA/Tae2 family protein